MKTWRLSFFSTAASVFYLKPGGDTPGNTLVVVGGFASLVTGVCVLTGEVDGPALFDAVQAGNFWQWVVRPGGD